MGVVCMYGGVVDINGDGLALGEVVGISVDGRMYGEVVDVDGVSELIVEVGVDKLNSDFEISEIRFCIGGVNVLLLVCVVGVGVEVGMVVVGVGVIGLGLVAVDMWHPYLSTEIGKGGVALSMIVSLNASHISSATLW